MKKMQLALAVKRRCHRCTGSGHAPCAICNGQGQTVKRREMNGTVVKDRCDGCLGRRTTRCVLCGGTGYI